MTDSQRKAKFGSFLSAGYAAFRADITNTNNPYSEQPFRDLWAKGWRDAEREFKRKVPFRHTGYTDDRTFDDKRQKFFKKFVPKSKQPEFKKKPSQVAPVGKVQWTNSGPASKDGLNLKRLERFNKKFRTKV